MVYIDILHPCIIIKITSCRTSYIYTAIYFYFPYSGIARKAKVLSKKVVNARKVQELRYLLVKLSVMHIIGIVSSE